MELERLKRSRIAPKAGDVFVYSMRGCYGYGRVVFDDLMMGAWPVVLIYLYDAFSTEKLSFPAMDHRDLLMPPLFVGPHLWRQGFFETLLNRPLTTKERYKNHYFRDMRSIFCCDERGNRISTRKRTMGDYIITTAEGVEAEIFRAKTAAPQG